jgi:hypothetical protein
MRDFIFLNCQIEHDWRFIGGRACGCEDGACSVSVYECAVCGLCDYGENDESKQIMMECEREFA